MLCSGRSAGPPWAFRGLDRAQAGAPGNGDLPAFLPVLLSWTIKNDGWFRIAQVRLTRERPMQRLSGFQNGLIAVYARILAAANTG
jgi:hypothetical protein